jgi:predicted acylesterase/phospholipase RssA
MNISLVGTTRVVKAVIWIAMSMFLLFSALLMKTNIFLHPFSSISTPIAGTGSFTEDVGTALTLRDFLNHPDGFHLSMAPAFFGFYSYLGALIAMEEDLDGILPTHRNTNSYDSTKFSTATISPTHRMKSVVGSSAGAMVAVLIAAGISPRLAANFVTSLTLQDFADPPGLFAVFRGIKFELLMKEFMKNHTSHDLILLERAILPVAVTTFDLITWRERIFTHGCMAQAARASATFPGLFQPVFNDKSILIDGGLTDWLGLNGLRYTTSIRAENANHHSRIVNIQIGTRRNGSLLDWLLQTHIHQFLRHYQQQSVSFLTIIITNSPPCGPWAMSNGILAVEATRQALAAAWDHPLIPTATETYNGKHQHYYKIYVDASLSSSVQSKENEL